MNKEAMEITSQDLSRWIDEKKSFYLIDVLGNEIFELAHIPNSFNACVYEVTFIEQVKAVTEDKEALIVVYGSGSKSMDSTAAAEKLSHEGYSNVQIFKGGIETWREEGKQLEGSAVNEYIDPQTILEIKQENRAYRVDSEKSILNWTGRSPGSIHNGSVDISNGEIVIKDGEISGKFDIDMESIKNFDLAGDELEPVLISHLKSDDFFLTKLFPKATFEIKNAKPVDKPYLSIPNFRVNGSLSLRGITVSQDFTTTVTKTESGGIAAEAHFDIDRTRWGIIYGSTRFFEHLGMHLVFDLISIQVKIIAD